MAYRTTRAFRAQFHLLALLAQLEEAQTAAAAAEARGRRRRARRARRGLAAISDALAAAQQHFSLRQLAAEDLLPGVREYLEAQPPASEEPRRRAAAHGLGSAVALAVCVVAWLAAFVEVTAFGTSPRLSLVAAELIALVLTPIAVFGYPSSR